MKLIDRYTAEVGKHLPGKNRADIEAEIRSTLEDMLEERSVQSGKPVDDALVSELLKEYGSPKKVAASYGAKQFLIGPRMYPFFEMVLKIVGAVLFTVAVAGLGINIVTTSMTGPQLIESLGTFALELFGGLISAFGNIVLVFAILERVLPAADFEDEEKDWDPGELTREPDPDQVKYGESIFSIIFSVIFLVILNVYPNWIGFGALVDGEWFFMPILSKAFFTYLPWINILTIAQILFSLIMIRQGAYTLVTRVIEIALDIAGVILAILMLRGPSLVAIDQAALAGTPLAEAADVLARIFAFIPLMVVLIIVIISTIEIAQTAIKLIRQSQKPEMPFAK